MKTLIMKTVFISALLTLSFATFANYETGKTSDDMQIYDSPSCGGKTCFGNKLTAEKFCNIEGYKNFKIIRDGDSSGQDYTYHAWNETTWIIKEGVDLDLSIVACFN